MTRTCLGLLAGMYALQLSSFADISDYLSTVFVAAIFILFLRQYLFFVGFVFGVLLFLLAAERLSASRIPVEIEGDSIVVTMRVIDFPSTEENSVSFLAEPSGDSRLPRKVRLSWFDPPVMIHMGDKWRLEVRLRRPRGSRNPGGFDYEAWLFREHLAAVGYVVDSHRNHLLRADPMTPVHRLRVRFVQRVGGLIDERQSAAVLMAIAVGARHEISREQWDRFAATGTSHLMAISGLHVGLCALGAYYLVLALSGLAGITSQFRNHHLIAIACSLLIAMLYVQVSGFAIPARRASLMLIFAGVYLLRRQRADPARILAVVACAIAVADPLATMAPGYVLSFAAVALLLWFFRCQRSGLAAMQVSLLMGLLPLTVLLFGRVSFAALPVNLLALPLFSLVTVPLTLIGMLCDGVAQPVGDRALLAAAYSVSLLDKLIVHASSYAWSSLLVPAVSGVGLLYVWLPAAWVVLPSRWPGREVAWLGIMGIVLYQPRPPAPGCAVVSVLDVGQGLAVAIRTSAHTVLYDTGPAYRHGNSAAKTVILPFFRSRGVTQIDRLVVSHADLDHAGGVAAIFAAIPVLKTIAGERLPTIEAEACHAGQRWSYDNVGFRVLHPDITSTLQGNDRSCVLLVEIGSYRLLLTGDIERSAEIELLQMQQLPRVQVATVPHHGSRTSSIPSFIDVLQPDLAVISAAHTNRWGLPKAEIVERWRGAGSEVLNTAQAGAIEIRVCVATGLESIIQYRLLNRRIWHE